MTPSGAMKPKTPTVADYRQLQRECLEIGKPFVAMISDIYLHSKFSMVYSPSKPEIMPTIIYDAEPEAERVRIHMKAAIDAHMETWRKRFEIEEV